MLLRDPVIVDRAFHVYSGRLINLKFEIYERHEPYIILLDIAPCYSRNLPSLSFIMYFAHISQFLSSLV